ncbi:MAG: ABC transporter substrate-binding protein [Acidobacteria bacterium]|nr:ABC transporter substrate-binding protein [Acidobacteriota bacterium]
MNRLLSATVAALFLLSCGPEPPAARGAPQTIRVGYFPNVTHSQAIVGLALGDFQRALGDDVTIKATTFNAGPSVIEALFGGEIDLAYIGPNPAINGFVQSKGEALRIVAGATSGGAALVVRKGAGIKRAEDLVKRRLASPQLGNTQDVALRAWLASHGLSSREKGGSVEVIPTQNPQILDLFRRGDIDGAWVPEPWASRLVVDGGGEILVDERSLWPGGDFVTAHVIVSTKFLREHPDLVRKWLEAHVSVTEWELSRPDKAKAVLNTEIGKLTGKELPDEVLAQAWARMRPAWDPIAPSLIASAEAAYRAGYLREKPDLDGIYDLALLNEVLRANALPEIAK